MRLPADADARFAEPKRGLVEVYEPGDGFIGLALVARLVSDPAAHGQHRDEDVRRIGGAHRHFHDRLPPREPGDETLDDALALDGDERGRGTERHAHLEAGDIAGLVFLPLRQQVHAIALGAAEPPFVLADDPDRSGGAREVAGAVAGFGAHPDLARDARRDLAEQQPPLVGRALASRADGSRLAQRLVGVKAADQPLAIGVGGRAIERNRYLLAREWLAVEVERDYAEAHLSVARDPAFAPDA